MLPERFVSKTAPAANGCILWTAAKYANGYGAYRHEGRARVAHKVCWELTRGPVPEGLQLDHLCRNRACVNPDHLEPVTARTNLLRGKGWTAIHAAKTHCPRGHSYVMRPDGKGRMCRECGVIRSRERRGK